MTQPGGVQVVRIGGGVTVQVVQASGVLPHLTLEQLADVADTTTAAVDTPLVWRKGIDGIWRPEPAPTADVEALALEVADHDDRITVLEGATAAAGGFRHTQSTPALVVQIVHGLGFRPAGVRCTDTLTQITEPAQITDPLPGSTTEVTFGAPFTGVIDVS